MAQNINNFDIQRAARTGKPIKYGQLFVYPMTVADYEVLWNCESALTIRLSALPVIYAIKPYAEALFDIALHGENVYSNGGDVVARADDWYRFVNLLCLSLHIPVNAIKNMMQIRVDNAQNNRLTSIVVRQIVDEQDIVQSLSVQDLGNLRTIIATLNGRKLPDESENAELAQAEQDIASSSGAKLDVNLDSLLATVARDQRKRIKDLDDWTIYEFELCRAAIERERRFTVYGIGEASGMVKFTGGNPFPSIFYDKPSDISAVVSAQELTSRLSGAVQEADSLPNLPMITKK
jgi:hypothetical protein